jgi:excisionase family DNA binding protein
MKPRSIHFGVRENTASSRQHASRLAAGTHSNANCTEEGPDMQRSSSENETPVMGVENSLHAATHHAATGGEATTARGLVDIHAAAQFLAVSVSTLYGWVWQRRISFVKVGRAVRFDMSDLQGFVEKNRIHARAARKW